MFSFDNVKLGQQIGRMGNSSGERGGMRYYPTGFPALDKHINGGLRPGLTVLGAIPTIGKSTLAIQIAETIARGGAPVLFYSLEMDSLWIEAKAASRHIFEENGLNERESLSANDVLMAGEEHKEQISRALEKMAVCESSDGPVEFYVITGDEDKPITAEFIGGNVKEYIGKGTKKPVVFIDYLQLLAPGGQKNYSDSRSRTDAVIEKLVSLTHIYNIPIFLISSLNRSSYETAALMQGFKDTGLIEYSADLLLGLQMYAVHEKGYKLNREMSKSPRDVEIVVLKQRYGACGEDVSVRLDYYPRFNYFGESGGRKIKKSPWQAPGESFFINNSLVMNKLRKGDYEPEKENRDDKNKLCFEISERVDAFDCAVMDAVYTLQHSKKANFNARDIYRLLTVDPTSISSEKKKKIERRIERLSGIMFSVEDKNGKGISVSGPLLPIEKLGGEQCKYCVCKGKHMPLYEHAEGRRHIRRYPQKMLSMNNVRKNTEESILLKLCLLRKIDIIRYLDGRQTSESQRRMTYDTILKEVTERKGKIQDQEIKLIRQIMDSYQRIGYIEGYEEYEEKTGIEIKGKIADPNELPFRQTGPVPETMPADTEKVFEHFKHGLFL